MRVVVPITVTSDNYAPHPATNGYSNVDDYDEWSIATAYVVGNRVIVDALQSQFECVANNTGTAPTLTGTTPWIRVGATNAWKPFDQVVSSQAEGYDFGAQAVDRLVYRLTGLGRFSTVCVLGTDCARVTVQFTDPTGVQTYNVFKKSVDTVPVVDAWTYCFADLNVQRDFVFDMIDGWGASPAAYLDVIVNNDGTGLPVRVGEIVVGNGFDLGVCHADAQLRLVDYSVKQANAFGDFRIVPRAYSRQGTFDVEIPAARRNSVQSLVATLRATPAVYFPSEADANGGLVIYGFPVDFEVTYATPELAHATLQIEGLT